MTRNLTVLLVEDDQTACTEIVHCVDVTDGISLIGVTNSADKAVELIRDFTPDAVILDLELHQGSGNGLSILQQLQTLSLPIAPYVLVTTNNSSAVTYESARRMGADFIMSKHQQDYSPKSVIDFLIMTRSIIHSRTQTKSERATTETSEQRQKRIRRRIHTELNLVGVSPKMIGFYYLSDAIEMIVQKPTKNLCGLVAGQHQKTEASVERAMQNAINKAWKSSDVEMLLTHYSASIRSEKGVPTITEFVYYYANKIADDY